MISIRVFLHQDMTPEVIVSVPDPTDKSKPMIRIFDNKFPALIKPAEGVGVTVSFVDGLVRPNHMLRTSLLSVALTFVSSPVISSRRFRRLDCTRS